MTAPTPEKDFKKMEADIQEAHIRGQRVLFITTDGLEHLIADLRAARAALLEETARRMWAEGRAKVDRDRRLSWWEGSLSEETRDFWRKKVRASLPPEDHSD